MKYLAVAAIAAAAQGVLGLNVHDFPKTSFSCKDKNAGEYYADLELSCQVYHICAVGQFNRLTKMSFACPNGTLFSQSSRICNAEDKVYCPLAERYYDNVQGNIDTQDDYRTVFQLNQQALFPLEPRRPAARRPVQQDDDYEDEPSSTAAPRRPQNQRRPPARPTSTTTAAPATRQRPPQRQFTPQVPSQQAQFPQSPAQPGLQAGQFSQGPQEQRPLPGNFLPPRQAVNSRNPPPAANQPQLTGVTQSPIQYAAPDRAASPGAPFIPPPPAPASAPTSQTQPPNRLVVTRPNLRRPTPLQGGTPSTTTSTPAPRPSSTTADPNAEYEYYDYEEPADGQQNANNQ